MRSVIIAILTVSAVTGADTDPVRSELGKHEAWTGEPVSLIITLYSPGPFSGTASFDLPELPLTTILSAGRPVIGSETIDGDSWLTQRHEFRVFTQAAGTIEIPSFAVRFSGKPSFTDDPEPIEAATDALTFESKRPPGTNPGELVVAADDMLFQQTWQPKDALTVTEGDVVIRTITRTADNTTAMMFPPPPSGGLKGRRDGRELVPADSAVGGSVSNSSRDSRPTADEGTSIHVYSTTPQLSDRTERGEFSATRIDTLKYQLKSAGTQQIPDLTFTWWDVSNETLQKISLPGITVNVVPAATADAEQESADAADSFPWIVLWVSGGLILLLCFLFRQHLRQFLVTPPTPEQQAARQLARACDQNETEAAYQAVLEWKRAVSRQWNHAPVGDSLRWSAFTVEADELSSLLFKKNGVPSTWQGSRLKSAFIALRADILANDQPQTHTGSLPPLNP